VILGLLCYALRFYIPAAFTQSSELINYTAKILQQVAIFVLLEGIGGVGGSIVRGTGRQTLGAVIIFISCYVIALPVGIPLMFLTPLRQAGLWWGYILGIASQNIGLIIFLVWMNWNKEADDAQQRAGVRRASLLVADSNLVRTPTGDDVIEQPSESTRLLASAPTTNFRKILLWRLLALLGVSLVLIAGILVRVFLSVPFRWTDLCIPVNSTDVPYSVEFPQLKNFASYEDVLPTNATLTFCNETVSLYNAYDLPHWAHPITRAWV